MVDGKEQKETGADKSSAGEGGEGEDGALKKRDPPTVEQLGDRSFVGFSYIESFLVQSENMNMWTDSAKVGCIMGFAVFFLGYLCTIVYIAVDMRRRDAMYQELIDGDLAMVDSMGLTSKMREFEKELAERLAGKKDDEGVDDQLVTQALELRQEEYQKYL